MEFFRKLLRKNQPEIAWAKIFTVKENGLIIRGL